ncbi:MAG: methylcobamide--CoM methyltransferase [Oscillospiraceae bacterium]|jgi:[methyl-Co(III) methanol-specific corrinoid protein]:coenzyme M methyltransferase|nr:methylcobamide--CoM methyltransferase [Oscillospiraceae bacterium]
MSSLSPKERLLNTFARKAVDRKPVICPGGMMNAAIVEVMDNSGKAFPEAHSDAGLMTELALAVNIQTGFENIGIPFCMTVEAEALGSAVDFGTRACEPKIAVERYAAAAEAVLPDTKSALESSRSSVIATTVEAASRQLTDVPVIGSLTGPISTAGSLVDPMRFLKDLRKDAAASHALIDKVADFLIEYAYQLIEAGADVISIADPTATGEILGPKMFEDFAVRYINRVADGIHRANIPVIVHICGDLKPVKSHIAHLHADAVSADAMVDLVALKAEFPELVTMGNLSTYLLEFGTPEKVAAAAEILKRGSIDIIAPACGLSTSSPLANIKAFTDAIRA